MLADIGAQEEMLLPDENNNKSGVMFTNGPEWVEQRRFVLKTLRDFGFGKSTMEELINEEISKAMDFLREVAGPKPVQLFSKFNIFIVNSLWALISGESLDYADPKLQNLILKINAMMTSVSTIGAIDIFPWLKYVAPNFFGYAVLKKAMDNVYEIGVANIDKHEMSFDVGFFPP